MNWISFSKDISELCGGHIGRCNVVGVANGVETSIIDEPGSECYLSVVLFWSGTVQYTRILIDIEKERYSVCKPFGDRMDHYLTFIQPPALGYEEFKRIVKQLEECYDFYMSDQV